MVRQPHARLVGARARRSGPGWHWRCLLVAVVGALALGLGAGAARAQAAPSFGCTASAARLDLDLGAIHLAGVSVNHANPGEIPCANRTLTLADAGVLPVGLSASALDASTALTGGGGPVRDQTATASSRVADVQLLNGALPLVRADVIDAQATAACSSGAPVLNGTYTVTNLRIGTVVVDATKTTEFVASGLDGLPTGALVRVVPGEEVRTAGSLIKRGVHVTITLAGARLLDLVLAEAKVSTANSPCAITAPPTVTLQPADGHTLVASAVPAAGREITSCQIAIRPHGSSGAFTPVTTTYDKATRECRADASAFPPGQYDVQASATDDAGLSGSASGTVIFSAHEPTAQLLGRDGRTLLADATAPGSSISSCVIGVRRDGQHPYVALPTTYNAATHRCTADLPRSAYPPGTYQVRVVATNAEGATATDEGTITIPVPTVRITRPSGTAHPGDPITAVVSAPPGTTITSCTITITRSGSAPRSLPGRYDPASGTCNGTLPADTPAGPLTITVTATDSDGETGRASAGVTVVRPTAPGKPGGGGSGGAGPNPFAPGAEAGVADLYLACQPSAVVLIDVTVSGRRVHLRGAARTALRGKRVAIRVSGSRRVIARPKVRRNGLFRASVPLPLKHGRFDPGARYQARLGKARSLALKVTRRMAFTKVAVHGRRVTISGRATGPLLRKRAAVRVLRQASCTRTVVAARTHLNRGGRFTVAVRVPRGISAALFRATTRVRGKTGRGAPRTFTLPRAVAIR